MAGYVVAVKPSARRANAAVGRLVARSGASHCLASRAAADAWAAALSERGGAHVWIRDANPGDDAADGYLVRRRGAWRARQPARPTTAARAVDTLNDYEGPADGSTDTAGRAAADERATQKRRATHGSPMPEASLADLLARNARHVESLAEDHFDAVQDGQAPPVVSVCCSDSRVSQTGMFDVDEPGWLFTPSNIGNQVWDEAEGERVVDGSVAYPLAFTGTGTAAVVGHTGCGAVTAALDAARGEGGDAPAGVAKRVEALVPVAEDGLDDERVREDREAGVVDQLVEYNVDRQVAFLRESDLVDADVSVYGFVYDFQGVYGDVRGRTYLVNAEGETDVDALRDRVPEEQADWVGRLLDG